MVTNSDLQASSSQALLEQRAQRFAKKTEQNEQDQLQLIGFERNETRYAISLSFLLEIRPLKKFCKIPGASSVVPGVFYHRGAILSGHDLHPYLGGQSAIQSPEWVLICNIADTSFGILADVVSDVTEYTKRSLQSLPVTFGERRTSFRGLLKDGTLVLDLQELKNDPFFSEAF